MKARATGRGLLRTTRPRSTALVALTATAIIHFGTLGCSEDEGSRGNDPSGGAAGSAGGPSGGTSGTGGSGATGGAATGGSNGGAGASAGGSSGDGAGGSLGGDGGLGGDPGGGSGPTGGTNAAGRAGSSSASCPETEPPSFDPSQMQDKPLCDEAGAVCRYGSNCCACNTYSGCGDEPFWFCVSPQPDCPSSSRPPGSTCGTAGMSCAFCDETGVWIQVCTQGMWSARNSLGCT